MGGLLLGDGDPAKMATNLHNIKGTYISGVRAPWTHVHMNVGTCHPLGMYDTIWEAATSKLSDLGPGSFIGDACTRGWGQLLDRGSTGCLQSLNEGWPRGKILTSYGYAGMWRSSSSATDRYSRPTISFSHANFTFPRG